ncbi:biofilm protein TabA [Raoultella sp. BIGb0399]|uniref:YhcH/YjgK/YiaL family protein n=1 Tax=Raoultella sp. BIGb0399 TaxID=2485119 RepID=UPI000F4CD656|nr:YhcH/YjgK/YiaL family protein [Raoultella sp. BIGb0399]ROS11140.1 biofilm protein TabA [Raoultella sp. BIGb0399]
MISGHISQLVVAQKEFPPIIFSTLKIIKALDFSQHPDGQFEKNGVLFKTFTAPTVLPHERKPETHKEFIDIQFVITGKERVEFCSTGNIKPSESHPEQDNYFYTRSSVSLDGIDMNNGDFVVFFPWDIHAPLCHDTECQQIRKIVAKVPLSAL